MPDFSYKLLPRHATDYLSHRRIVLFWFVALLALTLPWIAQARIHHVAKDQVVLDDCAVLNIHDGDTMTVHCDRHRDQSRKLKIRLYCIDAPELKQAPWGRQARDHLRELVDDDPVDVHVKARDRYGRTVGEVWRGRVNLNLEMVRDGAVAVYPKYCREPSYTDAQRIVQSARVGIWREPGLQQRPWEWRRG